MWLIFLKKFRKIGEIMSEISLPEHSFPTTTVEIKLAQLDAEWLVICF